MLSAQDEADDLTKTLALTVGVIADSTPDDLQRIAQSFKPVLDSTSRQRKLMSYFLCGFTGHKMKQDRYISVVSVSS